MNGLQRILVGLIPLGVAIISALAVAIPEWRLSTLLSDSVESVIFASTALAISPLALRRGEIGVSLLLGALFTAVLIALFAVSDDGSRSVWVFGAIGVWFVAILASCCKIAAAKGLERLGAFNRMLVIIALPAAIPLTRAGLWFTEWTATSTYDNYFYAFDGLLPIPVASAVARFCASQSWALDACFIVYIGFLLVFCAFVLARWRADSDDAGRLLGRWVVATLAGYALYYWLPGVGPNVAFYEAYKGTGSLPDPAQVALVLRSGFDGLPRNAMPSLHATWAFLIALDAVTMGLRARIFAIVYTVGTVIATLGLREHYLIDLVVAVPFALSIHAGMSLFERNGDNRMQVGASIGGAAMTVGWLLLIRYGMAWLRGIPSIATFLVLVTLLLSAWLIVRSEAQRMTMPLNRASAAG
ncbi:MAG: phosphatase PAP2 family protein [Proteobacteria bacterium]|nr:phosphatase PAP2 family protein [Pseudomonadota bacterium]